MAVKPLEPAWADGGEVFSLRFTPDQLRAVRAAAERWRAWPKRGKVGLFVRSAAVAAAAAVLQEPPGHSSTVIQRSR